MKKLLALLALAVGLMVNVANAGRLSYVAPGQGGGNPFKDATNNQGVGETFSRGWSCTVFTEYTTVTGSSTAINVSTLAGIGAAGSYYGPVKFKVQNIDASPQAIFTTNTSSAIGDTVTAKGLYLQGWSTTIGELAVYDSGPVAQGEHAHIRGLTAAARVNICGCHLDK